MLRVVKPRTPSPTGVTLIELLLCVGLIGVIAALAMPFYTNADGAREARDRRNAQTFCSMYSIVHAAGVSLSEKEDATTKEEDTKMEILEALREGILVDKGPLRGRIFRVPNMKDEEMTAAARFLELQDGELVYMAEGVGNVSGIDNTQG